MILPPFRIFEWVIGRKFANPPIRFDLASSAGPVWTVGQILALGNGLPDFDEIKCTYAFAAGGRALREAIAEFHGVDPDWVVVMTGASEAMSMILCLAARPNANVVFPAPVYSAFEAMAQAWGFGTRRYSLSRQDGFKQRALSVRQAVDRDTVLALVNTPHSPTGAVMPRSEIASLAAELSELGVPLVVDEVYHPLYFGVPESSAASIANVIVLGDMSKSLSLPGLRVGWLIDADAERRKQLVNARTHFTISNSPIGEAIATHALVHRNALLSRSLEVCSENLGALSALMDAANNSLSWVKPEGGTLAFPWFRDGRNSRPFCEVLANAGVLVAPGDCYDTPEHLRIGLGAETDDFRQALSIIERALQ